MIFFNFLAIIGMILIVSRFAALRQTAPLFVLSSIMLLLFLFASAKVLEPGAKILLIGGLGLFLFTLFEAALALGKRKAIAMRLSTGTVFFILTATLWFFLSRQMFIVGWDEFIWGTFAKAIKHSDAFYNANDIAGGFVHYTPGIAIFQYFLMTFSQFTEGALYFANGLIILSTAAVMIDLSDKKLFSLVLAIISWVFLFSAFYPAYYVSITIDSILGFVFGAGLAIAVFRSGADKYRLLELFPILAILPIIKETGIILAVVIAAVFLARMLLTYSWKKGCCLRNLRHFSLYLLIVIIAIAIPRFLWSYYLSTTHISLPYSNIHFTNVEQLFFPSTEKNQFIAAKFYQALSTMSLNISFQGASLSLNMMSSTVAWIGFFSFLFLLGIFLQKAEEKSYRAILIILYGISLVGAAGYGLFLLFCYQNFFTEYEGRMLASFSRYTISYVIGIGFLSLTCLTWLRNYHFLKTLLIIFIIKLQLVLHPLGFWKTLYNFDSLQSNAMLQESVTTNHKIAAITELIKKYIPEKSSIYLIYQNSVGMEKMILSYEVWPKKVQFWYWSLGDKYYEGDVWTNNFTPAEFQKALADHKTDYLVLAHTDQNFWKHYGSLFSSADINQGYTLFHVQFVGKQLILKPIAASNINK